jgi:hypothetical protein
MPKSWLLLASMLMVSASSGSASIIFSNTAGTLTAGAASIGDSFTTPSGTSYDDITFNYFSNVPATTPLAAGILYLFTSAYSGTPAGLSGAGAVAHSTSISSGMYLFDPSVTLLPNTQYFVYEDTAIIPTGGDSVIGDHAFFAGATSEAFVQNGGNITDNFQLSGTAIAAVPEPTSFALVIPFLAGLLLVGRRQTLGSLQKEKRAHLGGGRARFS